MIGKNGLVACLAGFALCAIAEEWVYPLREADEITSLDGEWDFTLVRNDDEKPDTSHRWPTDEDFGRDVEAMWAVGANDGDLWNRQIQILGEINRYRDKTRPALVTEVDIARIWPILTAHNGDVDLSAVYGDLAAESEAWL